MANNDKPVAMQFTPASTDEGVICTGCPIKNSCVYTDGMGCASIRAVRLNRAAEMKTARKCAIPNQYRTYDILGGMTVTRWFDKKHCKVIAKIRDRHPIETYKPEPDSCKCVVTFKAFDRGGASIAPDNILIDFSEYVILDYGYANMPLVRRMLMAEIQKWYNHISK